MFAIAAAFCFLWSMFSDHMGPFYAPAAGLFCIAMHLWLGPWYPWKKAG